MNELDDSSKKFELLMNELDDSANKLEELFSS